MWSVRVLSGAQAGQIYDLKLGKNVFGRGGVSDLKIQSLGISKEHCELHVYKDKMMIVDLKSSNGTFVNGVKIQNSILRVGDKVSLFDIIMDVIPTPDIRPKSTAPRPPAPHVGNPHSAGRSPSSLPVPSHYPQYPNQAPMGYPTQGGAAMQTNPYGQMPMGMPFPPQMQQAGMPFPPGAQAPAAAPISFQEKVENYIENVVMPAVYKLAILFNFKQVLMGFILIFVFGVTLLSVVPLSNLIKESNLKEASKRAKSIARSIAKSNEQALLAGQLGNLSVQEALKEEGIKEAFIIQQSDGLIVAPPDKIGRDKANSMVLTARKELRSTYALIDSSTIGASHPIGVYDPVSGEPSVKYHAIVIYDIGSLNVDSGRIISLFMQTLVIASVLGLILYFLFARLIEYPIKNLNLQIDKALLEKSDRTQVPFDYPAFQQLVSNVNTILNRAWSGSGDAEAKPQQNRDLEFSNLVDMVTHAVLVVDPNQRVVALNSSFEALAQVAKDVVLNQSYQTITDSALVQNIDSLVVRATQSPYEKHTDKIPFSQFECEVFCQAFLGVGGEPEYFVLTLIQINT